MSDQIIAILKRTLDDLSTYGELDGETRRNALKEELQFYVLNFIYHHRQYCKWVMYGGSALRVIHGLDRMSVDLDFEIALPVTAKFLKELQREIEEHFTNTYAVNASFLTTKITTSRGLLLKFHIGDELRFGHSSKQVRIKIDLNHFIAPKTVTEQILINHGQHSFIVLTYNKGTLMASKIAAILLRAQRGVGKNTYDYKGRDIYDLLWYMKDKTTPNFDYLNAKLKQQNKTMKDIRVLFDTLTTDLLNYKKMDGCLKDDLSHLFKNPHQFANWLNMWRDMYLQLLDSYKIGNIKALERVVIYQDVMNDTYSFIYWYKTVDDKSVRVVYTISDDWILFREGDLTIKIDNELKKNIEFASNGVTSRRDPLDKLKQYATLFYKKTEDYFKKMNYVVVGDYIATKIICMTAQGLNLKEQILLNKSALESRELDALLK